MAARCARRLIQGYSLLIRGLIAVMRVEFVTTARSLMTAGPILCLGIFLATQWTYMAWQPVCRRTRESVFAQQQKEFYGKRATPKG